ncbi:MAG: FAD:protein FMN transferase, partial [Actinomycetia bacterium]|nr:FAD:protein FMN transferase [Actinomycetes bacterium]
KGIHIDLGSCSKGYALDLALEQIKNKSIKAALLSTKSSTIVFGKKPDGSPWQIGIEHPRNSNELIGSITLQDSEGLSTSGDYQKYFFSEGKRYHHLLNPFSGYPANDFQSLTVISSRSCLEADILSTAIFIMDKKSGWDYILVNNIKALAVDKNGKVLISPEMLKRFKEL